MKTQHSQKKKKKKLYRDNYKWMFPKSTRRKNNEELDQHSGTYNMQKLVYLGCKEKERMKELKKKSPKTLKQ